MSSVALKQHKDNAEAICEAMADSKSGVDVRDRTVKLKKHKACFVATAAIDWLTLRLTPALRSREEAVDLATEFVKRGLIRHVTDEVLFFFFLFCFLVDVP